jgi:histidinol-phosphate aminotransferase
MKIDAVPLRENFRFDIPRLAESVRKARLVFLASPNNPTGTVLERADIEILARNCRGLLVIDEAYFEFHKQGVMDMRDRYDNLIVLRTFSKAFSLAGVRIGYLAASEKLALAFNKTKLPFSLSAFQQVAGTVLLKNIGRVEPFLQRIIEERKRVFAALRRIPAVHAVPSAANFFMFKAGGRPAAEVYEALRQRGVLVRCFGTSDTAEWLRVSIGLPEENDAFLANLRAIVEN